MAKKDEMKPVHPRTIHKAMGAYLDDVNFLMSSVRNACRFLGDETVDAERARKVIGEQLKEAAKHG